MNTINLLDNTDFIPIMNASREPQGVALHDNFSKIIHDKLILASKSNNLVYTQDLRGIGKTHELIMFAKIHDYYVVEPVNHTASSLRDKYNYEHIYSAYDTKIREKDVVVDECIDIDLLVKTMNCKIITGYSLIKINEDKKQELSFTEEAVQELKNEIKMLHIAMKNAIKNGDYSMYKNLIVGYRDTMRLIQDLDWRFQYSEYKTQVTNDNWIKQISIWQQNGDGNIKNHKVYNIQENISIAEKALKDCGVETKKSPKYRDLGDVLDDLNKVWKTCLEDEKKEISTKLVGYKMYQDFIKVMDNYKKLY